ncbi:helix-turn-helix transcriptional regulator [Paraburkholderia sp. CNPSo 3274]|uniref:helix-turn-helix transcriptional regulator n=1 Tax=Paraburkholderia sp. CNPSo 3274 TaxID=2940932 RepID=UPI0020B8174B|nr:helix-turn-helix transcriptional regulator [Paraburkholderia sp. CNPSo 3274]MCP3707198.1 helix-turn-helix transcriptional regulator [Paraburkholderia sp. CNPSo 3274]
MSGFRGGRPIDLLALLLPHIQHAVRTNHRLHSVTVHETAQSDALDAFVHAVLIVDSHARVIFANRAAEAMLAAGDGIGTVQQILVGNTASSTNLLHALVAKATCEDGNVRKGGAMLLDRPAPARQVHILATPLGAQRDAPDCNSHGRAAMLLLVDSRGVTRGVEARLTALFGLTPAEARVASEVGTGKNPNDIADTLRVLPSTVRTHLHHVFTKTATRGQAELVRLIAQLSVSRGD